MKVLVDPENFKKVYGHRPVPPQTHQNAAINMKTLSDLFAEKDLQLLGEKAQRLCQEKGIRDGFEKTVSLHKCLTQWKQLQTMDMYVTTSA